MANYSVNKIKTYFEKSEQEKNSDKKGDILEELTCYLFEKISGISMSLKDELNVTQSEEIDIAFWNNQSKKGYWFLPIIILVECKNTITPVASKDVSWFFQKLRNRKTNYGFLIATNGITGDKKNLNAAHDIIKIALKEGINIIVITKEEILNLKNTEDLIELTKKKLCQLTVRGTSL